MLYYGESRGVVTTRTHNRKASSAYAAVLTSYFHKSTGFVASGVGVDYFTVGAVHKMTKPYFLDAIQWMGSCDCICGRAEVGNLLNVLLLIH